MTSTRPSDDATTGVGSWNPRTGVTEAVVPTTSLAELDHLVSAARRAQTVLRGSTPRQRALWLEAVATALEAHRDELVVLADRETGLGTARLTAELSRTTGQLRMFADVCREGSIFEVVVDHADAGTQPPRPDIRRVLEPVGVVLVFAASNFPFAFSVAGGDTASAWAAGCPVLVKAHEGHPCLSVRTAEIISSALSAVGSPAGTFGLLVGVEAGTAALTDPRVVACGFTGSVHGGLALEGVASGRDQPATFYGELGSLNAVVVTPKAAQTRPEVIGNAFVGSFTLGNGQFCTKPGVLLVPQTAAALVAAACAALGDVESAPLLTERIRDGHAAGLAALGSAGARPLHEGGIQEREGAWASPSLFTTDAHTFATGPDPLREECFGPVALVVTYADDAELDLAIAALPGALTATVHAEDADPLAASLLERLSTVAGRIIWNDWPTGVAVTWAMHHGGPLPATTSPMHTSVGVTAVRRFQRPIAYQSVPDDLLPPIVREENPLGVQRRVDGRLT